MRRTSGVLLVGLVLLACKRERAPKVDGRPAPSVAAKGGGPRSLMPGANCQLPARFDRDVTIKAGCIADVVQSAMVENGATLTIEPGVKLRFHPGTFLEIGHRGSKLVARGTSDKPIVFTSAALSPKRGDWVGLVFDDTIGDSVLERAVVEYAGEESHGGTGALTVFRTSNGGVAKPRVVVRDTTFRENETAAVSDVAGEAIFSVFTRNTLTRNKRALRVGVATLAMLGEGNELGDLVEVTGGTVEGLGVWPKTEAPILITEPINVNGKGNTPASLVIPRGSTLRFAPKTWLEIGTNGPADFVARGVTFTSSETAPKAGDWVGILFGDKTRHAAVSESLIEYAGAEEHGGDAAVTFVGSKSWQALDVSFSAVRFRQITQAHFSSNGDGCDKALDPKYGIAWAGMLEPCR
ncbi:MAG: hypothetical protein ACXVEF_09540 [Polyangiales bacterium]